MLSHTQLYRLCLLNYYHTGQFAIDRAAANRFIKHAIAQAKDIPPTPTSDSGPTPTHAPLNTDGTEDTVPVPVKVTAKMLERERYQQTLREEECEEEGGDLKVIDGEESDDDSPGHASGMPLAAKGKSRVVPSETSIGKRRRPPIDPFAGLRTFTRPRYPSCCSFSAFSLGYDPHLSAPVAETGTTSSSSRPRRTVRTKIEDDSVDTSSGTNTLVGKEHKRVERLRKRSKMKDPPSLAG